MIDEELEEQFPKNEIRTTVPFWRFDEFLENVFLTPDEKVLLSKCDVYMEDPYDIQVAKLKRVSYLIQSKYN